jgi:hypothetical protein
MSIKNKDGTEYSLRKPNPLMKYQDAWSDFKLHNMNFDAKTIEANRTKAANSPLEKPKIGQYKTLKISDQNAEVIAVDIKPTPEPTIFDVPKPTPPLTPQPTIYARPPNATPTRFAPDEEHEVLKPKYISEKFMEHRKDVLCCLVAKLTEFKDTLYEDRSYKIKYVDKFVFEAIILEETDFNLVFWSHLDNFTKQSIIYPKNSNKRWWKINEIRSAPEGWFISCVPSANQPAFNN